MRPTFSPIKDIILQKAKVNFGGDYTFIHFNTELKLYLDNLDTYLKNPAHSPLDADYVITKEIMIRNPGTPENNRDISYYSLDISLLALMLFHKVPEHEIKNCLRLFDECPKDAIITLFQPQPPKPYDFYLHPHPKKVSQEHNTSLGLIDILDTSRYLSQVYSFDLFKVLLFKFLELAKKNALTKEQITTILNDSFFITLFKNKTFNKLSKDEKIAILNPVYEMLGTTLINHVESSSPPLAQAYFKLEKGDILIPNLSKLYEWEHLISFALTIWFYGCEDERDEIEKFLLADSTPDKIASRFAAALVKNNKELTIKAIRKHPQYYVNTMCYFKKKKISEDNFLDPTINTALLQSSTDVYIDFLAETYSNEPILFNRLMLKTGSPYQELIQAMVTKAIALTPERSKLLVSFLNQLSSLRTGFDTFNKATNIQEKTTSSLLQAFAKIHHYMLSKIKEGKLAEHHTERAIHFSGIIHILKTTGNLDIIAKLAEHIRIAPIGSSSAEYKKMAEEFAHYLSISQEDEMSAFLDFLSAYYLLITKGNPSLAAALNPDDYETRQEAQEKAKQQAIDNSSLNGFLSFLGFKSASSDIPNKSNRSAPTPSSRAPTAGAGQETPSAPYADDIPIKPATPSTLQPHRNNDAIVEKIIAFKFESLFDEIAEGYIDPARPFVHVKKRYPFLLALIADLRDHAKDAQHALFIAAYRQTQKLIDDPQSLAQCKIEYAEAYCSYQAECARNNSTAPVEDDDNPTIQTNGLHPTLSTPAVAPEQTEEISSESSEENVLLQTVLPEIPSNFTPEETTSPSSSISSARAQSPNASSIATPIDVSAGENTELMTQLQQERELNAALMLEIAQLRAQLQAPKALTLDTATNVLSTNITPTALVQTHVELKTEKQICESISILPTFAPAEPTLMLQVIKDLAEANRTLAETNRSLVTDAVQRPRAAGVFSAASLSNDESILGNLHHS